MDFLVSTYTCVLWVLLDPTVPSAASCRADTLPCCCSATLAIALCRCLCASCSQVELLHSREKGDSDHEVLKLTYPYQPDLQDWGKEPEAAQRSIFSMPAPMFYELHPFHIIMDSQLQLLQWGAAIGRVVTELRVGQHVREYFRVRTGCDNQASNHVCKQHLVSVSEISLMTCRIWVPHHAAVLRRSLVNDIAVSTECLSPSFGMATVADVRDFVSHGSGLDHIVYCKNSPQVACVLSRSCDTTCAHRALNMYSYSCLLYIPLTCLCGTLCIDQQCKVPSYIQLDYEQILVNTNSSFVLQSRTNGITLKGQMLPTTVQLPGRRVEDMLQCVWC